MIESFGILTGLWNVVVGFCIGSLIGAIVFRSRSGANHR